MRKQGIAWIAAMVVFLLLSACGPQGGEQGEKSTANASPETLYKNNCASCHGQNLEGNAGPSLEKIGQNAAKEDIERIIQNGKGQMPAQRQLSDEQRSRLASWLAEKK